MSVNIEAVPSTGEIAANSAPCVFCGAETTAHYYACTDRIVNAPGQFAFQRCGRCASLHIAPMPSDTVLNLAYSGDYMTHFDCGQETPCRVTPKALLRDSIVGHSYGYSGLSSGLPQAWRLAGRFAADIRMIRLMAGSHVRFLECCNNGTVLDVGCGAGQFLVLAKRLGWNAIGIEPDPIAAKLAKKRGCDVFEGRIEDFDPGGRKYDAITLSHVLEHFADPRPILSKLASALKEHGRIVSFTPNPLSLVARGFGANWYGLDAPRHIHIPTLEGLRAVCSDVRLRPTLFTLTRLTHHYARESLSIREFGRAHQKQAKLIPRLLGATAVILNWMGLHVGEEIVCIARRDLTSNQA